MSNIVIKDRTSFLPATQAKAFKPLNVPGFIKGIFPYADNERATPSMIKMNKGAALVALGGKGSPQAFITGLMYALSAHAWGQGKAEEMAKALPAYAGEALKHGAAFLPAGKGCDAGQLRAATEEGIFHMLTLPARKVTVERVNPVRVIEAPTNEAPTSYMLQDAMLTNPPMDSEEQGKRYAGHYLRQSQGMTAARLLSPAWRDACEKADKAEWRARQAESRVADVMEDRAIAILEFRKLADLLHIKLSAAQIKALAA